MIDTKSVIIGFIVGVSFMTLIYLITNITKQDNTSIDKCVLIVPNTTCPPTEINYINFNCDKGYDGIIDIYNYSSNWSYGNITKFWNDTWVWTDPTAHLTKPSILI